MYRAPVLIPTCNRIHHLKRCVESIARNKLAKETELYISVDYPPSEKYQDGYSEVIDYVKNGISGFKEVHIYIQDHNLGPSSNVDFLYEACYPHDSWIMTEDDNEFSANFLEYMNSGLDYYKDDNNVLFICAYKEGNQVMSHSFNCYTRVFFQPYGSASWRSKYDYLIKHKEEVVLASDRAKLKNVIWMYRNNPWCFRVYVNQILRRGDKRYVFWKTDEILNPVDGVIQLFLLFTNKESMFPIKTKSKTWGNDGSGFSMGNEESKNSMDICQLDTDEDFVLKVCEAKNKIPTSRNQFGWKYNLKLWVKYLLYRLSFK